MRESKSKITPCSLPTNEKAKDNTLTKSNGGVRSHNDSHLSNRSSSNRNNSFNPKSAIIAPSRSERKPTTAANNVIIAPTRAEVEAQKKFEKRLELLGGEETDEHGNIRSRRHEDQFFGGPLDGEVCSHQPNGPEASWDKGRYWADYFLKDSMIVDFKTVPGYHIYSSARSIYDGDPKVHTKAGRPQFYQGTRTASMRKCYYYVGFMEEALLILDGISPLDFTEVLTLN